MAKVIRREGCLWFVLVMWVGWRFVARLLGFVGEPNHTFPHNQGQLSLTWLTSAHSARLRRLCLLPGQPVPLWKYCSKYSSAPLGPYIMCPWTHSELICSLTNSTLMVCKKCLYSRTYDPHFYWITGGREHSKGRGGWWQLLQFYGVERGRVQNNVKC